MGDVTPEVLEALLELEAEACAKKIGCTLEEAREATKELWDDGELEIREPVQGKFILCRRGAKATWLHGV